MNSFTPIIAAIVGATSAFFFNYFHWKTVEKKRSLSDIGELMYETVDNLEKITLEYWLRESFPSKVERKSLEIRIVHTCGLIRELAKELSNKVASRAPRSEIQALMEFCRDIYEESTGGTFGSSNRNESIPSQANKIARLCSKSKLLILRLSNNY